MPTMTPTTRRLATAAVGRGYCLGAGARRDAGQRRYDSGADRKSAWCSTSSTPKRVKATVTNQQHALYKLSVVAKGPVTKTLFQIGPGNTYPTLASGSMGAVISTLAPRRVHRGCAHRVGGSADQVLHHEGDHQALPEAQAR